MERPRADTIGEWTSWIRRAVRGPARTLDEVRETVYLDTGDSPARIGRFTMLLVLSAIVATAGVLVDNAYAEPLLDQKKVRLHVTLRNTTGAAPHRHATATKRANNLVGSRQVRRVADTDKHHFRSSSRIGRARNLVQPL